MPWPWGMALWCKDELVTQLKKDIVFSKPYPRPHDWLADREMNEFPLEAMHHIVLAARIFSKPPGEWSAAEDAFYMEMERGLNGNHT